jgi:hypothetical protein
MRNNLRKVLLVMTVCLVAIGCGSTVESDARKLAELQCKAQGLASKALSGDMSVMAESTKLSAEAAALSEELRGKYESESDKQEFARAYLKAFAECSKK